MVLGSCLSKRSCPATWPLFLRGQTLQKYGQSCFASLKNVKKSEFINMCLLVCQPQMKLLSAYLPKATHPEGPQSPEGPILPEEPTMPEAPI